MARELIDITTRYQGQVRAEIFDALTSTQRSRFCQIEFQYKVSVQAVDIFSDRLIQGELGLTPSQLSDLRSILITVEDKKGSFDLVDFKVDSYKAFYESLSQGQKAIWLEKLGKPIKLFPNEAMNWLCEGNER